MEVKKNLAKLHLFRECADYNLGFWECPSFIFFVMGLINIAVMVSTYLIANRFTDQPEIVAILVIAVTAIIFIISHTVTQGFDKLAQANKMKTEFVSIASHQLRTPLSAMRWTLNLLNDGRIKAEELADYLGLIKESNERMIKLVNDLLDVSRIEMGKILLNPRQTNLYVLIQKIINNFSAYAKANNIVIAIEASETLPNVFADPEKISLVVQNLIDNAIKYIKGKGEIKISLESNNKSVKAAIKDTGVGIPASQQKFIFQKFFRSDNVMKHQTIGTGLGLFIAKSVVEESGGKIWFESQEGKGTTFYFTLPIYQ
jgi:signal transduction histidine kinase